MKALTVWQPWASLIMGDAPLSPFAETLGYELPKNIENRSWPTRHRGDLLIHAGKRIDKDWLDLVLPGWEPPLGMILGVVEVVDCVKGYDSPGLLTVSSRLS